MLKTTVPYKIIILISGNGSNLQAIIDSIKIQKWPITIAAVISDQQHAYGLERAKQANIPTKVLRKAEHSSRQDYDRALREAIDLYTPNLVVLAGFMRILTPEFVNHYQGRLINIHPSLLPKYKGLHTHQRVLDAQDKMHGISVHFVTEELDGGPIIAQMQLTIQSDDTADTLQQRVHQLEHQLYPLVIYWLAQNLLQLTANGVHFDDKLIVPNEVILPSR